MTTGKAPGGGTSVEGGPGVGLRRAAAALVGATDMLLGVLVVGSVALNFANVFGRYVLGAAILGADELQVYAMIAIVFLGTASLTWRDAHLRIDVAPRLLPQPAQRVLLAAGWLCLGGLAALVAWSSAQVAWEMHQFGQASLAAGMPMAVPHGIVGLGLSLTAVYAALRLFGIGPTERRDDGGTR